MFDGAPGETRGVLRFMTAGSVDDGKSTLIGRLLYDSKGLMRDQIAAISRAKHARADVDGIDLALVTDGLESEREQGITIDVAYRYFSTPRRAFVIADAPGHEQYTRNMVTAASTAELAVILIDASRAAGKGLKAQTRRHAAIARLMGLQVIVAVNKMDLVDWSKAVFDEIADGFGRIARTLGIEPLAVVPVSAKLGDNIARRGGADWYDGPPLLDLLEAAPALATRAEDGPFRFPIQRVARWGESDPEARRGYQGRVESGTVRVGDAVTAAPSFLPARVREIRTFDGPLTEARAGQSATLVLDRDLDLARGDLLASPGVTTAKSVTADLCWLDTQGWRRGRRYLLRQGARTTHALIDQIHFVREVTELAAIEDATELSLNDIASVRVKSLEPLIADRFEDVPATGAFVLIDPVTHQTAAAGMIREAHDPEPHGPVSEESYAI
jgi:sulfate adenylyltransferase subunit 1